MKALEFLKQNILYENLKANFDGILKAMPSNSDFETDLIQYVFKNILFLYYIFICLLSIRSLDKTLFYCRAFNMQCVALVLTAPNVFDIHCGQYSLFLRTSPCNRHSPTFLRKLKALMLIVISQRRRKPSKKLKNG